MKGDVSESAGVGHVFIFRGDLRRLACQAWYLPTDTSLSVSHYWRRDDPGLAAAVDALRSGMDGRALPAGWGPRGVRVHPLRLADHRRATPVLAAIPVEGTDDPAYNAETIRQFVAEAMTLDSPNGWERDRPLLAVPLVGTGRSGGHLDRGKHLRGLLEVLAEQAEAHGVDIALVTRDAATTAAAHAVRRAMTDRPSLAWDGLGDGLVDEAERLAGLARDGRLVVFSGAGLGRSAGLPDWKGLMDALADEAGFDTAGKKLLETMDYLDQAALVAGRLGDTAMVDRIANLLNAPHHGLSHGLLANLPVREFATMNYDELHEMAAAGAGQQLSVLPYESVGPRWLLKLHGCIHDGRRGDIVLTRSDYLRVNEHRATLTGLVQALLVTKHMLFVGFSLKDGHFHGVVHDVRRALGERPTGHTLGTALVLQADALQKELWDKEIKPVALGNGDLASARRLELLLDWVVTASNTSDEHLFDPTFADVLTPAERTLRDRLAQLVQNKADVAAAPAWQRVRSLLLDLGCEGAANREAGAKVPDPRAHHPG